MRHQSQGLGECLRNEQAIKGILMVTGKAFQGQHMLGLDR
jgi:hypothetical protein